MVEVDFIKEVVSKWVLDISEFCTIYLYGSYSDNTATEHSDIDLAIKFHDLDIRNGTLKMFDHQNQWEKILKERLGKTVHIELFDELTQTVRGGVSKSSILLYTSMEK